MLNASVVPRRGRAILWPSVLDVVPFETRDDRTRHEARPVEAGVKYAANSWMYVRRAAWGLWPPTPCQWDATQSATGEAMHLVIRYQHDFAAPFVIGCTGA